MNRRRRRVAWNLNAANISLDNARAYAEQEFEKAGMDLDTVLPNFDRNFTLLKNKLGKALNVPRIQMPVIEPSDIGLFNKRLQKGAIDIFKPYARGKFHAPKSLSGKEGEEWVVLGYGDGKTTDDQLRGKLSSAAVKKLLPTQSQIWFDKLIQNIIKHGPATSGSPILGKTIIVSKEGYILDGHHRFGQAILSDPGLGMKALMLPLDIKTLLKVGKSYGEAIGNRPKASLSPRQKVGRELERIAHMLFGLRMSPEMKKKLVKQKRSLESKLAKEKGDWEVTVDAMGQLHATLKMKSGITGYSDVFKVNPETMEVTHGTTSKKYKTLPAVAKALGMAAEKVAEKHEEVPPPKTRKKRKRKPRKEKLTETTTPSTSYRYIEVPGEEKKTTRRRKKSSARTAGGVKRWLLDAAYAILEEFDLREDKLDEVQLWVLKNFRQPVPISKVIDQANDEEEYFENL